MFLVAATLFVVAPAELPPAARHERQIESKFEQVASTETPKSIWRTEQTGAATHLQSTLACPTKVGVFDRNLLMPFDGFGFDVGCNFDGTGAGRITMYLTRRSGHELKDDLAGAQAAMQQTMPGITPVAGDAPLPKGSLSFTGALYVRTDGARTGVWVADISGWTFKFRATYPADREKDVLDALTELTGQATATAGGHLGACAAAPAIERNGTLITDPDRISSLSLVAGLLAAELDEKEERGQPIPENWCAEQSVADREAPMLFWRNIANTSDAGPMDRMSLMTIEEPPILVSFANHTASLISGELENKKDEPLVHQLVGQKGDTTYIFAFFNGRPSLQTLTPITKDVMLNKKQPLSGYNAKTSTITIPPSDKKPGT